MADLGTLKRGECLKLTRKNDDVLPFEAEGAARLEALARKADAGLFVVGSHSKKRPHTLTLGRVFDGRLLDALELHLSSADDGGCRLLKQFGAAPTRVAAGHKPCLFFAGGAFESDPAAAAARSLLLDLFRGRVVSKVNLAGIDRVLVVAASDGGSGSGSGGGSGGKREIAIRQYAVALKKSGTRVPRVELTEIGPSLRASLGRHKQAPPDLWKAAMKQPEGIEKKKVRERERWSRERKQNRKPRKKEESAVTILIFHYYISDTSCLSGTEAELLLFLFPR